MTWARGVPELVDTVYVRHCSGVRSSVSLKSFEQGGEKWQADPVDWIWFDEQPPEDVYFEGITRTNRTFGLVCMTFAPLKSILTVVWRFLLENVPDRADVQMIIEDAEHYFLEDCARITASYPPYEREARTKGVPALGSGRLFPIAGEKIGVAPEKNLKKVSNALRIALSAKPSTHQMPHSVTCLYVHALTPIRNTFVRLKTASVPDTHAEAEAEACADVLEMNLQKVTESASRNDKGLARLGANVVKGFAEVEQPLGNVEQRYHTDRKTLRTARSTFH